MSETFDELRTRTMGLVRKIVAIDNQEYDYFHYGFEVDGDFVWLMRSSSDGDIHVQIAHNNEVFWRELDAHLAAEIITRSMEGSSERLHADDVDNGFTAFASTRHTSG